MNTTHYQQVIDKITQHPETCDQEHWHCKRGCRVTTFHRICIKDFAVSDGISTAEVKRGTEYITSDVNKDGYVTVFTNFWFEVPVSHFAGEQKFT